MKKIKNVFLMVVIVIALIIIAFLACGCSKKVLPVEPPKQGHPRYEPDNSRHQKKQ